MRWFVALACGLALNVHAEVFTARVLAVLDGDTVLVSRNGKASKVRLANIDAPEKEQPFGKQSRQSLQELVHKREVVIDSRAVDQYGRIVGLISLEGLDINQEQLRRGMAWEYSYFHSDKTYVALQKEAQQQQRGLWAQADPQSPWQWRKLHPSTKADRRKKAAVPRDIPVMLYDMECGRKRRCSEMSSCDEARFYLIRCGVTTLDGDRDGEPCKALCTDRQ
ncbi:MAG: thermonuclease family protein [Nitrosomonadales bacterium]|nr:thermonuclease family protein [Nitrosomonadales bacterium]